MAAPKETSLVPVMLVLDTETGGLNNKECAVCSVSIHAVRLDTFERFDSINIFIQPYNRKADIGKPKKKKLKTKYEIEDEKEAAEELMTYSDGAFKVHGLTLDFLRENGVPYDEAAQMIVDFCKKARISSARDGQPFIVGQNILYDIGMIQQLLEYAGLRKEFCKCVKGNEDFHGEFQPLILDTLTLAYMGLCNSGLTNYKLGTLAEKLGIELDDAHDADADVTATEEIVRTFTIRMRNASGGGDEGGSGLVENKKEKKREHFKI